MLTVDILKSNSALSGLSEEQLNAIATLSQNDENAVIAEKTAKHWNDIDNDIKEATGLDKPAGMKSYEFFKNTLSTTKKELGSLADLKKQISTLSTEKSDLEKKIREGNTDESLKTQIKGLETKISDYESTVSKLRNDVTAKEAEFQKKLEAEAGKTVDLRFENAFAKSLAGVKFKAGLPQEAIDAMILTAKAKVKGKGKPEFITNDDGSESIAFRNEEGLLITNPENLQKPYTASGFFKDELSPIIDGGRKATGGGTNPKPGGSHSLDISGATTRVEADRMIRKHIAAKGIAQGTTEFTAEVTKLSTENKVSELPMTAF